MCKDYISNEILGHEGKHSPLITMFGNLAKFFMISVRWFQNEMVCRVLKSNLFQNRHAPTHIFKLFPANIWIFKFFIIMMLAVKMCLDNNYGLLNLL